MCVCVKGALVEALVKAVTQHDGALSTVRALVFFAGPSEIQNTCFP